MYPWNWLKGFFFMQFQKSTKIEKDFNPGTARGTMKMIDKDSVQQIHRRN